MTASDNPKNYYTILGVQRDADFKEISKAYRKLALKCHPDRNLSCSEFSSHEFHEILTAYEILKDPHKRKMYDTYGENGLRSNGLMPTNIDELFDLIFSNPNNRNGDTNDDTNGNILTQKQVDITLEELYSGRKLISIEFNVTCSGCDGNGTVIIKRNNDCKACRGKGKRLIYTNPGIHFGHVYYAAKPYYKKCGTCKGAGIGYESVSIDCSTCDASGTLFKSVKQYGIDIDTGLIRNGADVKIPYSDADVSGVIFIALKYEPHDQYCIKADDLYRIKPIKISLRAILCGGGFRFDHFGCGLNVECNGDIIELDEYHKIEGVGMLKKGFSDVRGDLFVKFEIDMPHLDGTDKDSKDRQTIQKIVSLLMNADIKQKGDSNGYNASHIPQVKLEELNEYDEFGITDDNGNYTIEGFENKQNEEEQGPECKQM